MGVAPACSWRPLPVFRPSHPAATTLLRSVGVANWESPVSSYMALATIDHVQGYEMGSWTGIVAPAGTPKDIINKMSSAMAINLAMPDINEKLVSTGMQPFISTPAQFAAIMKADLARRPTYAR